MPVTSIRISSAPARPAPKIGDRQTTKKHGLRIRIPLICTFGPGRGARVYRGSRPVFEWVKPHELPTSYRHLITAEERDALEPQLEGA